MFHNDNSLTLPAETYAYCKIWDRDRDRDNYCVIQLRLPWFSDIVEETRKFLS